MTFDEIIYPITREQFFTDYKSKKHFTVRSRENIFSNLFDWEQFDRYMNGWGIGGHDRCPQLQIVEKGSRWCKKKDDPKKYDAKKAHLAWRNGQSFILTLAEFLNKDMWNQCAEFEKVYGRGQANLYCSAKKEAQTFQIHADSTDNFLLHVHGKVRWNIYNEWKSDIRPDNFTLKESFVLSEGDVLYIPKGLYHNTETLSPRISISFHFHEPPAYNKREKWVDWKP